MIDAMVADYARECLRRDVAEMLDDPSETSMDDMIRLRCIAAAVGESFESLLERGTPFEQERFRQLIERWKRS